MAATVLVLENDGSLRRLLELALRQAGLEVLCASSREEAAAALALAPIACLLVDLNLGGGGCGFELARTWRAAGILPPFLVVTGSPDDPRVERLGAMEGFRGAVAKPFGVPDLVRRVQDVVRWGAASARATGASGP